MQAKVSWGQCLDLYYPKSSPPKQTNKPLPALSQAIRVAALQKHLPLAEESKGIHAAKVALDI